MSIPDPLDRAQQAVEDGKAAARFLKDADDWDEPTDRHEVHVNVTVPQPPAAPQPSQPEITVTKETTPTEEKTTVVVVKQVSVLAKLLPEQHRLAFFLGVLIAGSILIMLQQGWLRFGK